MRSSFLRFLYVVDVHHLILRSYWWTPCQRLERHIIMLYALKSPFMKRERDEPFFWIETFLFPHSSWLYEVQRVPISWETNWARLFQNLEGLQKRKALSGTLYNQRVTTSFWYFVFVFVFAWLMYVHRMSRPKAKRRSASILIECLCFKASSSSYKRSQNSLKENLTATHWLLSFLFACTILVPTNALASMHDNRKQSRNPRSLWSPFQSRKSVPHSRSQNQWNNNFLRCLSMQAHVLHFIRV